MLLQEWLLQSSINYLDIFSPDIQDSGALVDAAIVDDDELFDLVDVAGRDQQLAVPEQLKMNTRSHLNLT